MDYETIPNLGISEAGWLTAEAFHAEATKSTMSNLERWTLGSASRLTLNICLAVG